MFIKHIRPRQCRGFFMPQSLKGCNQSSFSHAFRLLFMKKIEIKTICKKLLADVFTPVGIYLRLRDRFRDTILLGEYGSPCSGKQFFIYLY
jgi:hypothetical protein